MHSGWNLLTNTVAVGDLAWLGTSLSVIKVVIGFSIIIFVHELGHFLAAKWAGIRVDRFAVGFGYRLFGWRRGEGFTLGKRPNYTADEQRARNFGETDYCLNALPFGGYVKMLGQDDIVMNDETGEIRMSDDPRAFTNKPVGKRMVVASAGVLFNVLFAVVAFACVYMIGKPEIAPRLGPIDASSPAAAAGLRSNDLVVSANGEKVSSFRDILTALVLANNGAVVFQVERDGHVLPDALVLHTVQGAENPIAAAGIGPAVTPEVENAPALLKQLPELRAGDRITEVAGQSVRGAADFTYAFSGYVTASGKRDVDVTVSRPDADDPGRTTTFKTTLPAQLLIDSPFPTAKSDARGDTQYILGLNPRRMVGYYIKPGGPADKAGMRTGDVIAQWGTIPNPVFTEIVDSIQASADRPIPVVVERDGKPIDLVVTPERPFQFFGTAKAQVGSEFVHEDRQPIVANVAEGTPASALKMPRGARILAINGTPTENWFDVARLLRAAAGQTVAVRYRTGDTEAEGRMAVPSSVVDALHLPPLVLVSSIAGENRLPQDNEILRLPSVSAVSGLLQKHRGETVTVEYQLTPDDAELHRGKFAVAADGANADPWQMRVLAAPPNIPFKQAETLVRVSNPVVALGLGARQAGATVVEVYRLVTTMTKNLIHGDASTMQHISGPVGIVSYAVDRAKLGYVELLGFLAFLSVNLAVINFIPFPVVDGGLMVFLVIEKIKGRPLSLKTQMVATLVGLATIILVFVLVTFKDISHLLS